MGCEDQEGLRFLSTWLKFRQLPFWPLILQSFIFRKLVIVNSSSFGDVNLYNLGMFYTRNWNLPLKYNHGDRTPLSQSPWEGRILVLINRNQHQLTNTGGRITLTNLLLMSNFLQYLPPAGPSALKLSCLIQESWVQSVFSIATVLTPTEIVLNNKVFLAYVILFHTFFLGQCVCVCVLEVLPDDLNVKHFPSILPSKQFYLWFPPPPPAPKLHLNI